MDCENHKPRGCMFDDCKWYSYFRFDYFEQLRSCRTCCKKCNKEKQNACIPYNNKNWRIKK